MGAWWGDKAFQVRESGVCVDTCVCMSMCAGKGGERRGEGEPEYSVLLNSLISSSDELIHCVPGCNALDC